MPPQSNRSKSESIPFDLGNHIGKTCFAYLRHKNLCSRAHICIVGGYDDYSEHGAYEFAQMKATINNYEDMVSEREENGRMEKKEKRE